MFRLYLEFARVMSPDRDNGKMVSIALTLCAGCIMELIVSPAAIQDFVL